MIVKEENITKITEELKKKKKKIVFTNGCFDILHLGHIIYLSKARSFGDVLVVGLNSDASVKKIKGNHRPVYPENDRAEILNALRAVDYVIIFNEETPNKLISIIQPDIHVKGGDWDIEDLPETKIVKAYGGEVKIVPFVEGRSTSTTLTNIFHMSNTEKSTKGGIA